MGTLFVVATPIGNLGDISSRALDTLRNADLIACEDTRQTLKLLSHFGIQKPLTSYHEFNEREKSLELADRVERGESIALVSDAGTPAISDPGYRLVRLCRERGLKVAAIPGANAAMTALSASGLPSDNFLFAGFLPPPAAETGDDLGLPSTRVLQRALVAFAARRHQARLRYSGGSAAGAG